MKNTIKRSVKTAINILMAPIFIGSVFGTILIMTMFCIMLFQLQWLEPISKRTIESYDRTIDVVRHIIKEDDVKIKELEGRVGLLSEILEQVAKK